MYYHALKGEAEDEEKVRKEEQVEGEEDRE